ncbi:hypothetical protein [Aquimarina algiphila]|uniref:hypothetical protein n=1 Tax=Aquimarina algiphila TaxID=2047982 RepID=UPI0023300CAE|nr:hypothetical protein [Aquimarina algiphila]
MHKKKSSVVFLLVPFLFFGQLKEESKYYNWFDQVLGQEHTGLHNGKWYLDFDVNRIYDNRHAFFRSDEVLMGSVTYSGQTYYDIKMKYNLEIDRLLVQLKSSSTASVIKLIPDKIDEFVIDGSRFIRIDDREVEKAENILNTIFYEVLLETEDLLLLKSNKKVRNRRLGDTGDKMVYEFTSANRYILSCNEKYYVVKSKYDIVKIYPELKKEIKQFYTTNKILKKSEPDRFMKRLFEKVVQPSQLNKEL